MAMGFANPRGMGSIQEERGFTNPHVRFIRRNGKVIPIVNKKRIGQDVSSMGRGIMAKGTAVLVAGLVAKKTGLTKKFTGFNNKTRMFKLTGKEGRRMKTAKNLGAISGFLGKASVNLGMKVLRNSKKVGFGGLLAGGATVLAGDDLQMRSGFGKDFFFIKDNQGRRS